MASAPRLLAISDGALDPARTDLLEGFHTWLDELSRLPGVALLLREKQLDDRALFALAQTTREHFPGQLLISGRPDLAVAASAEGVHLPAAGLPVAAVRRRFPALLVGVSAHAASEIALAAEHGAHYATFGPVFPTPSKHTFGPAQGLDRLAAACGIGLPVLAIGGIDPETVAAALGHGAYGVAGIRWFAAGASAARLVEAFGRAATPSGRAATPSGRAVTPPAVR